MKPPVPVLLFVIALIFPACEKEEVLPARPPADTTTVAAKKETPVETTPPTPTAVVNSELYQYGKFGDMPYRFLVPRNYDPAKRYPLLVFLHGIGERGTNNEKQLAWGSKLFQVDSIGVNTLRSSFSHSAPRHIIGPMKPRPKCSEVWWTWQQQPMPSIKRK